MNIFNLCEDVLFYIFSTFIDAKTFIKFIKSFDSKENNEIIKLFQNNKFVVKIIYHDTRILKWLIQNKIRFNEICIWDFRDFNVGILNYNLCSIVHIIDKSGNFGNKKINFINSFTLFSECEILELGGYYDKDTIVDIQNSVINFIDNTKCKKIVISDKYYSSSFLNLVLGKNVDITFSNSLGNPSVTFNWKYPTTINLRCSFNYKGNELECLKDFSPHVEKIIIDSFFLICGKNYWNDMNNYERHFNIFSSLEQLQINKLFGSDTAYSIYCTSDPDSIMRMQGDPTIFIRNVLVYFLKLKSFKKLVFGKSFLDKFINFSRPMQINFSEIFTDNILAKNYSWYDADQFIIIRRLN